MAIARCDGKIFYVYIMASHRLVFYVGFTSEIEHRVWQHKNDVDPDSFCTRYRVHKLVYLERYSDPITGINREKYVKKLSRAKKIALIKSMNPFFKDLSAGWGKPYRTSEIKIPLLQKRRV